MLVRLGEDSGLELKQARFQGDRVTAPHRDGLADGFAAFANSGGGRVVLGITDDRTQQALTSVQLDLLANLVTEIRSDVIRMHRPHPANVMKTYQLELIEEHLREKGYLA